ncbi:MAG: hypothetical protein OEY07_17960, partial [Gammaproteobacteria bacterium]|nr:hypothetical protein [Gammaproteobacteria bacterium]
MNVSLNLTGHVLWINAALRRFSKSSYWTVRKDVAPNVVHGTAFFADFDQRPQHHRRIEYQVQWLSPAIHHSTDWSTHSNTEATSSKKTGDLLMNEITNTCANNDTALQRYRELQEKYRNHYAQAPARFLAAWKEAIRLAGP